ncbi:elongator complex protein 2-like [Hibiscus syriacus]|uniref:Elongator complex protein 2-like n=1 Tax=Hibiscus syriacus TaxID=106335 RepID=A0A6A2ZGM7_HIBSY|nr:elongator complex protein 2-like [Hibiscus syriacus]
MEPQPLPPAAAPLPTTTTTAILPAVTIPATYPDSINSSPRSRNTDSMDDPSPPLHSKIRVMCSYGGTIVPRPHDKVLCYIGGDTRMVVVDRHTSLASLQRRLSISILHGRPFTLKYQLPSEDLDSLISVTTDEDVENMIDEYDRTCSQTLSSNKYTRIRLFLFPINPEGTQMSSHSMGPILNNSTKSDEWFLNALNGEGLLSRGFSDSATKANCLLGLDDDRQGSVVEVGPKDEGSGSQKNLNLKNQDVKSVTDSPIIETNSSFGSTSSSRVHADDQMEHKMAGIEEQFAHLTVTVAASGGGAKQQDEGLMGSSSVPQAVSGGGVPGENTNSGCSDDERSDHGVPVGYKKSSPPQSLPQGAPLQNQQKSSSGHDLASPDSVSSDCSSANPLSRQKHMIHQDQVQIPSGTNGVPTNPIDPNLNISDPNANARVPLQQLVQQFDQQLQQQQQEQLVQDSSYILQQPQFDQQLQQQQQQHQLVQDSSYILQQPQFDQQLQQQQQQQQLVPDCDYIFQQPQFDQQLKQQQQQLVPDSGYILQQFQFEQQQQEQRQQQQQQLHDSVFILSQSQFDQQFLLQQQHQQQHRKQLVQDSGYILQQPQFDQQLQQSSPPQFLHTGATHYIHQHTVGAVPMSAYYHVHHSQQHHHAQIDQTYPLYYVPTRQTQAYKLTVQQLSMNEGTNAIPSSHQQTPNLTSNHPRNAPIANPEMAADARAFGTSATGTPQLVQVPTVSSNPANAQMYSTQHLAPTMPSHFQTMTGGTAVVLQDSYAQRSTDNINQQIKTSQPM